jgi:hypothetical protein
MLFLLVGAYMPAGIGVLATASGAILWVSAAVLIGAIATIEPTLDIRQN